MLAHLAGHLEHVLCCVTAVNFDEQTWNESHASHKEHGKPYFCGGEYVADRYRIKWCKSQQQLKTQPLVVGNSLDGRQLRAMRQCPLDSSIQKVSGNSESDTLCDEYAYDRDYSANCDPNIAPAAAANSESGTNSEVSAISNTVKTSGPQAPRPAIQASIATMSSPMCGPNHIANAIKTAMEVAPIENFSRLVCRNSSLVSSKCCNRMTYVSEIEEDRLGDDYTRRPVQVLRPQP